MSHVNTFTKLFSLTFLLWKNIIVSGQAQLLSLTDKIIEGGFRFYTEINRKLSSCPPDLNVAKQPYSRTTTLNSRKKRIEDFFSNDFTLNIFYELKYQL